MFLGARRSQERKAQRCENEQHARPVAGAQAEVMRAAGRLSGRGRMAGARLGSALSAARDYYGQTCVLAKLWQSEKGGRQWEVRGPELGYRTSNEDRPGRKGSSGLWAPGRIGCGGAGCRRDEHASKELEESEKPVHGVGCGVG